MLEKKVRSALDSNGLLHVSAKKSETIMKDNSINWIALRGAMDKLDNYEIM